MSLLSIIIPVYNVENYLDECLRSILFQEFKDYEIILVNNASTDKSGEISEAYASKYNNITLVHLKKNIFPSGARNVGISLAKGDYIHFCDSDDFYVENGLTYIGEFLSDKKPDVVFGQFVCKPEKGAFVCNDVQLNPEKFNGIYDDHITKYLITLPKLMCTPWRVIVKRGFLIDNNLLFPEGYHTEDEEWFPKVICSTDSFALLTEPFYCYRPRATGSITSAKTYMHSKFQLMISLKLIDFLFENQYKDARRAYIISRIRFLLGLFATRCDTFDRDQLHELAQIIQDNTISFSRINDVLKSNILCDLVMLYGPYMGLALYRTYVTETTLETVFNKEHMDIYVFPTGFNGEGTARIIKNAGYNIKGFLDNSELKAGCIIDGLSVQLPKVLKDIPADGLKNVFVVVSIQQEYVAEILINQLRELGLDDAQVVKRVY